MKEMVIMLLKMCVHADVDARHLQHVFMMLSGLKL